MSTMNAATYKDLRKNGGEIIVTEVPKPISKEGYAVVKVVSAAINPIDEKIFSQGESGFTFCYPFIPGYDFSGIIESIGSRAFNVNDEVFGTNWGRRAFDEAIQPHGGAFAEYIIVPVSSLSKKPFGVYFDHAAGVAMAGSTALEALEKASIKKSGQKVLIIGGAGAVGQIAISVAKRRGVWVATTASSRNINFVLSLGANKVYDYNSEKWEDDSNLKGIDAVLDLIGEKNFYTRGREVGTVKEGGAYVSIVASSDPNLGKDPHPFSYASSFLFEPSSQRLDKLANYLADGSLRLKIDSSYPFTTEGVNASFDRIATGKAVGKVILNIL